MNVAIATCTAAISSAGSVPWRTTRKALSVFLIPIVQKMGPAIEHIKHNTSYLRLFMIAFDAINCAVTLQAWEMTCERS